MLNVPGVGGIATATPGVQFNQFVDVSGHSLRVSATGIESVLGFDGIVAEALRVDVVVERPEPWLLYTDYIGVEDGHLVMHRNQHYYGDGGEDEFLQVSFFHWPLHPGALAANWVAGQDLASDWTRSVSYSLPGLGQTGGATNATFKAEVQSLDRQGGGCVAQVIFTATRPGYPSDPTAWRTFWTQDSAFPSRLQLVMDDPRALDLQAVSTKRGEATVSPFVAAEGRRIPSEDLHMGGPEPSRTSGTYSYQAALDDLAADEDHRAWLQANPGARLLRIEHRESIPEHYSEEEWKFTFQGRSEQVTWVAYVARDPLPVQAEREVIRANLSPLEGRNELQHAPPMASMERVAAAYLGAHPSWVLCNLAQDTCQFGLHDDVRKPRAGEPGSFGFGGTGLTVHLKEGALTLDDRWQPLDPASSKDG